MTSAIERRRVFVDTAAFFALSDTTQANHGAAMQIQQRLMQEHWQMVTTNFIIAETHALALRRTGRREASGLLERLDKAATEGSLNVIPIGAAEEARAREIIRDYDDKDFSLTDATSFAVMGRLRIRTAFTSDRNFAQYGLDVLSPQP